MSIYLSNTEKLNFFSSLGNMLASGIPILEAFDSLQEETTEKQKKLLQALSKQIEQGNTLTESLGQFPEIFDPTTLAVLSGAEQSGTLEESLQNVVENLEKEIEFEEKVKDALMYPAFILIVFIGVLLLLLLFVIPRIATIFERLRVPIPFTTQLMVSSSEILRSYPVPIIVAFVLLAGAAWYVMRYYRRGVSRLFFSLPLISQLGISIDLARFFRSFSLLIGAGIPITEALELSYKSISSKKVATAIKHVQEVVLSGNTFSEGLIPYRKVISPVVIRMISSGEKSGNLEKSSQQAADFFEKIVNKKLRAMTVLLEPVMILILGLLIGGIMLSVIGPIYSLIGQVRGG